MFFSSSKCPLPALVDVVPGAAPQPRRPGSTRCGSSSSRRSPARGRCATWPPTWPASSGPGESLEDAFAQHQNRFPPLFLELVAVGEQTGRLEDTFQNSRTYYESTPEHAAELPLADDVSRDPVRRSPCSSSRGLIWILGMLGGSGKAITTDPTGLGFTGTAGAITFMAIALRVRGGDALVLKVSANNVKCRARMEGMLMSVPGWGPALLAFALQRFAVALRMCVEAGLSGREDAPLLLPRDEQLRVHRRARRGRSTSSSRAREFTEALLASGARSRTSSARSVLMGEETGNMSEVMERLAERYARGGRAAAQERRPDDELLIYGLVAVIILAIFRIASLYLGMLGNAGG